MWTINGNTKKMQSLSQSSVCKRKPVFCFLRSCQWTAFPPLPPQPQVCMEVQVHKSKFSKKYFPLVPEVLLLAVFGKIITLLSLGHNDSLILSPEAVAARWAFLLLLLVNGRRGYSVCSQKKDFLARAEKSLTVSLNSAVPLVSILG